MESLKTPDDQCKRKMESKKKRYQVESAAASNRSSGSPWQCYPHMGSLFKGTNFSCSNGGIANFTIEAEEPSGQTLPKVELENSELALRQISIASLPQPAAKPHIVDAMDVEAEVLVKDDTKENNSMESDSSTDSNTRRRQIPSANDRSRKIHHFKHRKKSRRVVGESFRMLACSILKIEQAWMEMHKDAERMRLEAEIRRGEIELKRTEILTKTQLEIAKLLSKSGNECSNKNGVHCPLNPLFQQLLLRIPIG